MEEFKIMCQTVEKDIVGPPCSKAEGAVERVQGDLGGAGVEKELRGEEGGSKIEDSRSKRAEVTERRKP